MYEQLTSWERDDIVRRLAAMSTVLSEDDVRRLISSNPAETIELLKSHEEARAQQEKLRRSFDRLRAAIR